MFLNIMKKLKTNALALSGILAVGILFSACKKDNFENNNPEVAGLMAFNLAPDRTVEFGIGGNALTNNPLAFNSYTGGYIGIMPGSRSVVGYDFSSGDTLASASFDFEAKKYYSSFLLGNDGNYQNVIVNDNFDSLSSSDGQAYVRYINAINGSGSPTVKITSNGTDVVNTTVGFATVSEFIEVTPGEITIDVSGGTNSTANRTITVEGKSVYTILLSSGASSADPAQIKFVSNGVLAEEVSGQRISSSAQIVNIN
jgi:hypothetical protein